MAGAIAGTALVNFASERTNKLSTVTLTVNNLCNFSCPHCYLQYADGSKKYISDDILSHLYLAEYKHLVIVGKEPLVNEKTINIVEQIAQTVKTQGKTVGLITNGFGLDKVKESLLSKLSYIDISFDGGAETYSKYRGGDFGALVKKAKQINERYGFDKFNVLHVVNDVTINSLEDMLSVRNYFKFKHMMFSPYIETRNDGFNSVKRITIDGILKTFAKSKNFRSDPNAFILLDTYHLMGEIDQLANYSEKDELPNAENVRLLIKKYDLSEKVKLIENDPILHGFVRLTYDGFVLSPYASLNPADYKVNGEKVSETSLLNFFNQRINSLLPA